MQQPMERKLSRAEFAFVEKKLYDYPINKRLIDEFEAQKEAAILRSKPQEGPPSATGRPGRPTEITAIQLAMLEDRVKTERFWVKAIEDVLECLSEEEKELVELKYFEAYLTNEGIMMQMSMSRKRFYRLREEVVYKFARRMAII